MYQVYNTYTGEVYGKFVTEEEAEDVAWVIEDELQDNDMPFRNCVNVRNLSPEPENE